MRFISTITVSVVLINGVQGSNFQSEGEVACELNIPVPASVTQDILEVTESERKNNPLTRDSCINIPSFDHSLAHDFAGGKMISYAEVVPAAEAGISTNFLYALSCWAADKSKSSSPPVDWILWIQQSNIPETCS